MYGFLDPQVLSFQRDDICSIFQCWFCNERWTIGQRVSSWVCMDLYLCVQWSHVLFKSGVNVHFSSLWNMNFERVGWCPSEHSARGGSISKPPIRSLYCPGVWSCMNKAIVSSRPMTVYWLISETSLDTRHLYHIVCHLLPYQVLISFCISFFTFHSPSISLPSLVQTSHQGRSSWRIFKNLIWGLQSSGDIWFCQFPCKPQVRFSHQRLSGACTVRC